MTSNRLPPFLRRTIETLVSLEPSKRGVSLPSFD
jgi:hypothetical protein